MIFACQLTRQLLPLLMCVLFLAQRFATVASVPEEEQPPLSTEPYQQSLLTGSNTTVACHLSQHLAANYTSSELIWYFPNGTQIEYWNWLESNISAVNGTLTAIHLTPHDSGEYTCSVPGRQFNASATLKVYSMPSYLSQITLVYAVDGVLLLAFLAFGIHSLVLSRRSASSSTAIGDGSTAIRSQKQHQAASAKQQQQQQMRQHSRQHSRVTAADSAAAAAATAGTAASHEVEASLDRGDDNEVAAEDAATSFSTSSLGRSGSGGVKSHRHHSTVPKPTGAD